MTITTAEWAAHGSWGPARVVIIERGGRLIVDWFAERRLGAGATALVYVDKDEADEWLAKCDGCTITRVTIPAVPSGAQ